MKPRVQSIGAVKRTRPWYIGLKLDIDGAEQRRNYSLSALCDGKEYRISVKREAGGKVSNYLHDELVVGDTLKLFPPAGDFTLAQWALVAFVLTAVLVPLGIYRNRRQA